jgi:putative glutamine amidotransferase
MIIAVSMRVMVNSAYPEVRDAISHDWVRTLDALSVTPVFVPNVLRDPAAYLSTVDARGLILTGGDDLGPLPGEPGEQAAPNERDRTETALLTSALQSGLPVLGVCRGLQLINVHFGGALVRDLSPVGEHVNVLHTVEIVASTPSGNQYPKQVVTNSYHSQGVRLSGLAPELKPFAVASGDVVEGLCHPDLPVLAVQWHPERQNPASEFDRGLLKEWLGQCE